MENNLQTIKQPTQIQILLRKTVPYQFIIIPLVFYFIFFFLPALQSFYLGLFNYDGYSPVKTFVGLENFRKIIFEDKLFTRAITNNVYWTIGSLVLPLSIGLILATLFNTKGLFGRGFFRTMIFMPYVLSMIVVALLWSEIYNPQNGIINRLIEIITGKVSHIAFLGQTNTALISVLVAATWSAVGFYMVIFYAGLQTIPEELYECASLEGANGIQSFIYITLPMLKEVLTVMIVITVIGSFKVFDIIYTMTHGGPLNATEVTATRMIAEAFSYSKFGYAAAYSTLIFLVIAIFSAFYLWLNRRQVGE
ncbi:MAG: carbohydrate ABC transporter permease [Omnitrophica WOR_2 bacterium]